MAAARAARGVLVAEPSSVKEEATRDWSEVLNQGTGPVNEGRGASTQARDTKESLFQQQPLQPLTFKFKSICKSKCGVSVIQGGAEHESGYRTVCSIGALTISLCVLILKLYPQVR